MAHDPDSTGAIAPVVSQVPQMPPTLAPMPPGLMIMDTLATRFREALAIAAYFGMAYLKIMPGLAAGLFIALIVLPVGLTRELAKIGVARAVSGTATKAGPALVLGMVAYQLRDVVTYAAPVLGAASVSTALIAP